MRRLLSDVREIYRLATDPERSRSYFPHEPRKSRATILADLLLWRLRRGEVNEYYFCWGLDRLAAPRAGDLLSLKQFKELRNRGNRSLRPHGFNYVALTRDKYLFALLLEALGYPTPPLLALVEDARVEWLRPRRSAPLSSLLDVPGGIDAFYKPRFGGFGKGVVHLGADGSGLRVNGQATSLEQLASHVDQGVLQQRLVQHGAMAALHPSSVNTMRVITVRDRSGARVFSKPVVRIGHGRSVVDNGAAGGIQVFVDPATGRLQGPGIMVRGGMVDRHPDTGVLLDGFEVPHFFAALELAARLHHEFPGLHTVGWDVAITEAGPVFVEGNDGWVAGLRIGLVPDFKRDFTQLCQAS